MTARVTFTLSIGERGITGSSYTPVEQCSAGQGRGSGSSEPFPFKVLLRVPEVRNIPVLALAIEKGRSAVEHEVLTGPEAVKQAVKGNMAGDLEAGRYGAHHVISERRRVGLQTALYATWLAFADAERAIAFVRDHPRLGLQVTASQNEAALPECEDCLRHGLASGRSDLSYLTGSGRLKRAREYVALSEEVKTLRENQRVIGLLRGGLEWNAGV